MLVSGDKTLYVVGVRQTGTSVRGRGDDFRVAWTH